MTRASREDIVDGYIAFHAIHDCVKGGRDRFKRRGLYEISTIGTNALYCDETPYETLRRNGMLFLEQHANLDAARACAVAPDATQRILRRKPSGRGVRKEPNMARKNATQVIEAFKVGKATAPAKETGRGGPSAGSVGYRNAIWTDGTCIYSYKMKIAERLDDGTIWIVEYSKAPTATTRSHVRACQMLLQSEPIVVVAEERMAEVKKEEREAEVTIGNLRLRAVG